MPKASCLKCRGTCEDEVDPRTVCKRLVHSLLDYIAWGPSRSPRPSSILTTDQCLVYACIVMKAVGQPRLLIEVLPSMSSVILDRQSRVPIIWGDMCTSSRVRPLKTQHWVGWRAQTTWCVVVKCGVVCAFGDTTALNNWRSITMPSWSQRHSHGIPE